MSNFPDADAVLVAYEDHVEALTRLLRAGSALSIDPRSRFYGLAMPAIQDRLRSDRVELDRWVVMMLAASFEAAIRTDARERIKARTKDVVRRPLSELYKENGERVHLEDILKLWEGQVAMGAAVKTELRTLLKHRHWLAHGRYWTNKHGALPSPYEAHAAIEDYVAALRAFALDFPMS